MRKLSTANITSSAELPIKAGTLVHLQLSYQEALTALGNAVIGRLPDLTRFYVLFGCVNTGSGLDYNISAGAIYYNGEVYLVDATTFTAAAGQVAIGNIVTTQYNVNADPVTFTNGQSYNIHNIQKIVFTAGTVGTGIANFSDLLHVPQVLVNDQQANLPASYTVKFDQDKAVFFAGASVDSTITFDFTNAVPGSVVRLKWTFGSGRTLTINQPSGSSIIRDSGNLGAVASANNLLYMLYCGKNSNGDHEVSYTLKQY